MKSEALHGHGIRQSPIGAAVSGNAPAPSAKPSAALLPAHAASPSGHRPALLTAAQAAGEIYGISERTFHVMRAQGLICAPIVLGPRLLRWSRAELEASVASLPRKEVQAAEPVQLATGRAKLRQRIQGLKANGGSA